MYSKHAIALAAVVALCAVRGQAQEPTNTTTNTTTTAPTTTTTSVPVNLNQNIVTTVLIMGVTIGVTLIFVLYKLIPKLRSGEVSFKKIEFDWRAELLNQTSKKEKARLAEERARREQEMAARRYGDVDETGMQQTSETQPRMELRESDVPASHSLREHRAREEEDAQVTFRRE